MDRRRTKCQSLERDICGKKKDLTFAWQTKGRRTLRRFFRLPPSLESGFKRGLYPILGSLDHGPLSKNEDTRE